jgi:hypothetical protein
MKARLTSLRLQCVLHPNGSDPVNGALCRVIEFVFDARHSLHLVVGDA